MNSRWRTSFCLLVLLLLSSALLIPSVTAEAVTIEMELSPPPIDYTGTVTINGEPAPVGTEVTASVDGQKKSSTTLDPDGVFNGNDALTIQGTRNDINKTITFSVTEVDGTTTPNVASKTYYPSGETVLDINIEKAAPEVPDESDGADTKVTKTEDDLSTEGQVTDEFTETTEPPEPSPAPGIFTPLGTSQVIITEVIQQALSPISQVQEISIPITMAIERVEAITGLAIFDNFLAFLLIGFIVILFLIMAVYRRERETEEERRARLRAQSSLLADQNRPKK